MTATYGGSSSEYVLDNPPNDCIQSVKFGQKDSKHLLVSSWDCTVRLYDIVANQLRAHYTHDAPVLDSVFEGPNNCWSAGADCKVKRFDFPSQNEIVVGYHSEPVRSIEYIPDVNLIASGGWDGHVKLWDPRTSDVSAKIKPVSDQYLSDKVYSMSTCGEKLIVGTSGRRVIIWDLRNMSHIQRESLLKYQIRSVEAFANRDGYVVSSIEGRVAVEYFDPSPEVQKLRYAFKCHRNKDPTTGMEIIYPVNTASFHKKYNTFATGGSDGYVSIWDGKSKKRLVQFRRYPTSVSSICFSPDGETLAVASSYLHTNEETYGLRDTPPDSIHIRKVADHEVRNKP